ncbi:MAG: hypothetical protein LBI19_04700 [Oscillospiraceae bacterium]|jgi:hypothetical protein|nr:hypothetical protein [Oscillospiraceae bacterium]
MFAVLETVTVPARRGWPRGSHHVAVRERPRYISVTLDMPLGIREDTLRKRAFRALRAAKSSGSAGVVLPKGFPFPGLPAHCGLAVSSPVPLLRRLAASLCRFAVEEAGVPWGRVRLSLINNRSTPELLVAAQSLASTAQTFHIDAGEDTGAVCYLLRSRCGVPAAGRPVRAADGFWDVYILFGEPPSQTRALDVRDGSLVINLSGGTPALAGGQVIDGALLEPPRSMWKDWPAGCDNAAMLAALLATGQVALGDIRIRGLTRGDTAVNIRS